MCIKVRSEKLGVRSKKGKLFSAFFFLYFIFFSMSLNAQCAMCRAAIESEGNNAKAQAVNDGIVYLMIIPYLLVAAIGYAVYRLYAKKKI
ncbi:hypothetical protein [Flavobacterium luteum]|uniref:hypothetical protein n=1 Tax=Flavobacterium luteum TaxID=2026654 RepID=UPI001246C043|nr:hypothetical protein [Flavobacterium luteum]